MLITLDRLLHSSLKQLSVNIKIFIQYELWSIRYEHDVFTAVQK